MSIGRIVLLSITVILCSSFASNEKTICLNQDAEFHSSRNIIKLDVNINELWLAQSPQVKTLAKGCYDLRPSYTVVRYKTTNKLFITSQFYRLINLKNNTAYSLERRIIQ